MNIVLLGHPGSGKGTMAALIKEKLKIPHISTGNIFREIANENTDLGGNVKKLIDKGNFVPDDIVIKIVKERLSKEDCKDGFILDGFPRTLKQAKELDQFRKIDKIINLHVEDETSVKRLLSRWQCKKCSIIYGLNMVPKENNKCDKCKHKLYQRDDDKLGVVRKRIKIYHDQTKPVVDYYSNKNNYFSIDAEGSVEEVFDRIYKVLKKQIYI